MDKEEFHNLLTQDGLPSVGTQVGLGTTEELTSYTQGCTTQVQMGLHVTAKMESQRGTPQGAGQSIHAGNMNTLPAGVMANRHYKRYLSHILGSIQLVWVDNVFALAVSPLLDSASRGPAKDHPMQGILVDTLTYNWTINGIANPLSKMQWWCSDSTVTITRPTKECLQERMGQFWVTDSPAQRAYTLEGGNVLSSKDVLKLLGCTMSLRKEARLAGIRRSTQTNLERCRCATARMVTESKMMSRWYAVATVYRPTKWDHDQGCALMRCLYKRWCGISRYARWRPFSSRKRTPAWVSWMPARTG